MNMQAGNFEADSSFRVVVIGSGMSGILMGIRLLDAGITNFTIYEKTDRVGGTWRENTYPGIACDVPSHHYCYSFEMNPDWSHRFPPGAEIQSYFEKVADKYGIYPYVKFNTEIEKLAWDGSAWNISIKGGATDRADIVVSAAGVLHHPVFPDIAGLEDFAGDKFHTAQWDHSVDLSGKRFGIIGTGSTAAQIIPSIVDTVGKLSIFQRTAQWVHPQPDKPYSSFQKKMFKRFPFLMKWLYRWIFVMMENGFAKAVIGGERQLQALERRCRKHLDQVRDPELKAKLTPDYRPGCKRLIFSDTFYDAVQKQNVDLVTESIDKIVPEGVLTKDGKLHELDVLVLSTGFDPAAFMRPIEVIGEEGVSVDELWKDGPRAYRSVSLEKMPNLFMLIGPHGPVGNQSLIMVSEYQSQYIMKLIAEAHRNKIALSAKKESVDRLLNQMNSALQETVWVTGGCQSWYLLPDGNPALYPWEPTRYYQEMSAGPDYNDFEKVPLRETSVAAE